MQPLTLEGDTLGQKHQHYNKLVNDTSSNYKVQELSQDDDIRNLLNIDVACRNRNVDYILEVLKSDDQLYISKAIKRSTWLYTDPQYSHIINPEYLYTDLYSQMTSKAFNKLILNIRLHLKDEKRVETFYQYVKNKDIKSAFKWLQHCSIPFVEVEIEKHNEDIPDSVLIRLSKKSFSVFKIYDDFGQWNKIIKESKFLLKNNVDSYLDILEKKNSLPRFMKFGAKHTNVLMKKCSQRVLNKFNFYGENIHLPTFANYLKKYGNIENFLFKYATLEGCKWLYYYDNFKPFVKLMANDVRFEFVKKVFIDKEITINLSKGPYAFRNCYNVYQWYEFVPFDFGFRELKRIICSESNPIHRNTLLQVMLSCAGHNKNHIRSVLQYYHDKHINEPNKFKIQFANFLVTNVQIHTLDEETWDILVKIFINLLTDLANFNDIQPCLKAFIVRSLIRHEQIPEIISHNFIFDTFETSAKEIQNEEEKDAIFEYLRDYLLTKLNHIDLNIKNQYNDAVTFCGYLFKLFKDWRKELHDHPYALDIVKNLVKAKNQFHWKRNLTQIYHTKKTWRKMMFEESIAILQNENACLNALKHDPNLLTRNHKQVSEMCFNNTISLHNFFRKIRIYWPHTLAEDFKNKFLQGLKYPGGHKTIIISLCTLLNHAQVNDLVNEYAPSTTKIDRNETDELVLSFRQQIAKNVHKSRPPPLMEGILLYSKGDYLQYAVPSIEAIFSQMSPNKSRLHIPILLNAPVSLQKFGIRFAFHKLTADDIKPMFLKIWTSTKNLSIRTVLFTRTFMFLCKEKNDTHIKDIWDLLSSFIDKLTPDENKIIYKTLGKVSQVPESIKPEFYMKSYTFLSTLPVKCHCENIMTRTLTDANELMSSLDNDFVVNVMLKKFYSTFATDQNTFYTYVCNLATFILASNDEETQLRRYDIALAPLLEKYLPLWDQTFDGGKGYVSSYILTTLERLASRLFYTKIKEIQVPLKVFETIQAKLESILCYQTEYVILTEWKQVTTLVSVIHEISIVPNMHQIIAPIFAKKCVQHLKEDTDSFGETIYLLFSQAFSNFYEMILEPWVSAEDRLEYITCLLKNQNDKEIWLMVSDVLKQYLSHEDQKLCELIFSNPSDEIKMHYYQILEEKSIRYLL